MTLVASNQTDGIDRDHDFQTTQEDYANETKEIS
jgi:hypothetical protein